MRQHRLLTAAAAASVTAGVLLFGGLLRPSSSAPLRPVPAQAVAEGAFAGFSSVNTQRAIQDLEAAVASRGDNVRALASLGLAYQQRARETGDPTFYSRSDDALTRAGRLAPNDVLVVGGLASLALSQHRFADALALGRRAQRLSPSTARTYGAIGDALVQLGRYDAAFRSFDRMAMLKPSLSAYARVSYARELLGRRAAALEAMELAVDAAGGAPEPTAWSLVELGKLHWSGGDLPRAERDFRAALRFLPGYASALDGLAGVAAARGELPRAIRLARSATERSPLPEYVGRLGDLYRASGREAEAREQYRLIRGIERLLAANGVRTELETALFDVDHGIRLRPALQLARVAHRSRPSIDADDVLAWALERNGRCGEALRYSKRALRLGTLDAPKMFHRGMIERCLGNGAESKRWFRRALDTNPHFSIVWAPVARRLAA